MYLRAPEMQRVESASIDAVLVRTSGLAATAAYDLRRVIYEIEVVIVSAI